MPSIRIDCPGEVPVVEYTQQHTRALLESAQGRNVPTSALVKAQALDLLDDGQASGIEQDQLLVACLEALRQLLSPGREDWQWRVDELRLSFGPGRKIRPSEAFRAMDLRGWMESLEDWKMDNAARQYGKQTPIEQTIGLPDPARLIVGAALCLLEGYLAFSGSSLHATYHVRGSPRWVDVDEAGEGAGEAP